MDVDRLDRNLRRWQEECDRLGLANRPHIKTHKSVEIARRQLELGAVGLTCQKLGEAETMIDAGLDDVLIAFNLVGDRKLERLAGLMRRATVRVTFDDPALLPGLAGAARAAGEELGVLVDCDTGLGRTGVTEPARAATLAAEASRTGGLRFDGFLTYPVFAESRSFLEEAVELADVDVPTVSVGGTPTMWHAEELRPLVTEYRAGVYAFGDLNTIAAGVGSLDEVALTVRATVVSRPAPDRAVLDAGTKALAADRGRDGGFGHVVEVPSSAIVKLDEEHAYLRLGGDDSLRLGQTVSVVPNHACPAVNLHDDLVAVQAGEVVDRWRVDARGKIT
ncbi:MAG TPA: alanine racemase [Gaiellaceae bacterium]|nr:alanine racemase [Gaiellaceae bacterium]